VVSKSNKPNKRCMAKQGSKTTYSTTPLAGVETKFQLCLLVVYVNRVLAVCWLLLVLGRRTAQARARCDQIDAARGSSCESKICANGLCEHSAVLWDFPGCPSGKGVDLKINQQKLCVDSAGGAVHLSKPLRRTAAQTRRQKHQHTNAQLPKNTHQTLHAACSADT
jgi:hypothetical protein